ncbi:timeless-domain-containing protein [Hesseltinella vesiculosa]|uniref:Timeless-domain-containing protein n=1 Tax=Hesseltinella vesiculosa TaxID=101127 RepID=A0A1X2GJW5_9FUNG|nr:timeless-domain-containing protein [Hesseltinella vesiculosa]
MEVDEEYQGQEHTRNLILSTCTALGGFEDRVQPNGVVEKVYLVGDEALPCLKDLKRIIRVDEVLARDVLIGLNVLESDLIPIVLNQDRLGTATGERFVLACLEIIVPMTWPLPKVLEPDLNPNLVLAYRKMKHQLLEKGIFEAALRICAKSLKIPLRERSGRDEAIIRLTLYFWRNLTAIPDPLATEIAANDLVFESSLQELLFSRLFESNALELILTIASNAGVTDSAEWNPVVLEILFYLLEYTEPKAVFKANASAQVTSELASRLSTLMSSEHQNKKFKSDTPASRHNRFGGSYVVQGWDGKKHVSMKQQAGYASLDSLFNNQKKNRAGVKRKQMDDNIRSGFKSNQSLVYLRQFSQSFMESCFNTFYTSIFKSMQREDKALVEADYARHYFTQRWFLEFVTYEIHAARAAQHEREKERHQKESDTLILPARPPPTDADNSDDTSPSADVHPAPSADIQPSVEEPLAFDYDLVANTIDLTVFGACMRRIRTCIEDKRWFDVKVAADCLRQMLVIVSGMANTSTPEYQEVSDYIQSNLYHEQSTLDIFPDLIRTYKDQSLSYLDSVIQLVHVILKLLERYCKKEKVLFVRKKRKAKAKKTGDTQEQDGLDNSEDEEREQQMASHEHAFAFEQFEKRFVNYDCVQVCCQLLEHYQTLEADSLHCITSIFHRLMVKKKAEHLFWKIPTLELFNRILQDRTKLPKSAALTNLYQFITFVTRQFFKKADAYPLLFVETFFKVEPCRLPTPVVKPSLTYDDNTLNST